MSWYQNWKEKYKKDEKVRDLIHKRESIMECLILTLETEESLQLKGEIDLLFENVMDKRLKRLNEEKTAIEKWIGKN